MCSVTSGKRKAAGDSEGKQMMFLVRSAFWLVLLIILIPTDAEQQKKMFEMAQTAVADVRGFCVRNPATCDSGQYAVNVLVQKAQYGAQMIQDLVSPQAGPLAPSQLAGDVGQPSTDRALANESPERGALMPVPSAVPIKPTPWLQGGSQNTLSPEDLQAEWSGPNV
jgi:hypothetical protein